jgi:hypothetical protein
MGEIFLSIYYNEFKWNNFFIYLSVNTNKKILLIYKKWKKSQSLWWCKTFTETLLMKLHIVFCRLYIIFTHEYTDK